MRKTFIMLSIILSSFTANATIHVVYVWDGYFQFLDADITIELGDTVQWLPLDVPSMMHTITSSNIPEGAAPFDQIWQAPADTFFQYVPQFAGLYEYVCTPHIDFGMVGTITVLDGTTSLHENNLSHDELMIYPNPAADKIHFAETNTLKPYRVYDSNGKMALKGTTNKTIDISTLINGTYFIEIEEDKSHRLTFIKQ